MSEWHILPYELLLQIFEYLPRRALFACSMVCNDWQRALNQSSLWKKTTVYLDFDLQEPSIIFLSRLYHTCIKTLEFGFSSSHNWYPNKIEEITKKTCRFLIVLNQCHAQIECLKLFDWSSNYRFKKIIYHLARFLNIQENLKEVILLNTNLHKDELLKILKACIHSKNTLNYLSIQNYYASRYIGFDSAHLMSCFDQFYALHVIKMEYSIFSKGVIDSILTSRNRFLDQLELTIRPSDAYVQDVTEEQWMALKQLCQNLKVSLFIKNVCYFEEINFFLKENIPLNTFSLQSGKSWDQCRTRNYRSTLALLLRNYQETLVNIQIRAVFNKEMLDDFIINFIKKCPLLQTFDFQGMVQNMEFVRDICRCQKGNDGIKLLSIVPSTFCLEDHIILSKIHFDFHKVLSSTNYTFELINNALRNPVYVYY